MKIKMLDSVVGKGRDYYKGQVYEVPEEVGRFLLSLSVAVEVAEDLKEELEAPKGRRKK